VTAEPITTSRRRFALGGVLMWGMVAATGVVVTVPVLASFIIDEFDISRARLGFLLTVLAVLGALSSPTAGRIVDAVGGRNALVSLFVAASAAFLVMAASPAFAVMFVAAAIAGIGGSAGNPSTNKLISHHLPPGRRGTITGVKQTGPQVGSFLAGILAPLGATTVGWRPTLAIAAAVMMAAIPFVFGVVPADDPPASDVAASSAVTPLPKALWWVAVYGFLLGFGGSSTFLVPLFAEEQLGLSVRAAGLAAALIGLMAVAGRLGWARAADRGHPFALPLGAIALVSVMAALAFLGAIGLTPALLWVGVVAIGLSSSSWTSVGALAVISEAGTESAGRASGVVWFGFLAGIGLGPPLFGYSVDETGSYAAMWWMALGAFVAAVALMLIWGRSRSS
jgi:predicted MFS family arabinose efflux permease